MTSERVQEGSKGRSAGDEWSMHGGVCVCAGSGLGLVRLDHERAPGVLWALPLAHSPGAAHITLSLAYRSASSKHNTIGNASARVSRMNAGLGLDNGKLALY